MRVVRGDSEILRRAAQYAQAGHYSQPQDGDLFSEISRTVDAIAANSPQYECKDESAVITRLNIGNTYRCNMGCTYCYNEFSSKDKKGSQAKGGMSLDVSKRMIDTLIEQSEDEKNLSLVFIGGEPLLEKKVLFETVGYAKSEASKAGKTFGIAIYTNGTLMDMNTILWANDQEVSIVVSLDGPPALNDKSRVFLNGKFTSKLVLKNIELLMRYSTNPLKRVRAVCENMSDLLPLHKYFLSLGFNEIHTQALYDENGIADEQDFYDVANLISWYKGLLLNGVVISVNPFDHVMQRLAMQGASVTSWYPCTAGRSSVGVHQNGDVYPCHHFFEEDGFKIGNVMDGLPSKADRRPYFKRVDKREPCSSCWAKYLCGGECYHRAHTNNVGYDGVLTETCKKRKAILGLIIDMFADIVVQKPEVIKDLVTGQYSQMTPEQGIFNIENLDDFVSQDR